MQRLNGNFFVKRSINIHTKGGSIEIFELPSGQWQIGKGPNAVVIVDYQQIEELLPKDPTTKELLHDLSPGDKASIIQWCERVKREGVPKPIQQGATPMLQGQTARDRLSTAIENMSDEVVNRLLLAVESTLGPVADSIKQAPPVNSHSAGYGDHDTPVPAVAEPAPFQLPPGAKWAQEGNPAAGYLTYDPLIKDGEGRMIPQWHQTPQFIALTESADRQSELDTTTSVESEMQKDRELVGAGAGGGKRSTRTASRSRK